MYLTQNAGSTEESAGDSNSPFSCLLDAGICLIPPPITFLVPFFISNMTFGPCVSEEGGADPESKSGTMEIPNGTDQG